MFVKGFIAKIEEFRKVFFTKISPFLVILYKYFCSIIKIYLLTCYGDIDLNYLRKIERVMIMSNFEMIRARVSEKIRGKNAIFSI